MFFGKRIVHSHLWLTCVAYKTWKKETTLILYGTVVPVTFAMLTVGPQNYAKFLLKVESY